LYIFQLNNIDDHEEEDLGCSLLREPVRSTLIRIRHQKINYYNVTLLCEYIKNMNTSN